MTTRDPPAPPTEQRPAPEQHPAAEPLAQAMPRPMAAASSGGSVGDAGAERERLHRRARFRGRLRRARLHRTSDATVHGLMKDNARWLLENLVTWC